jgi:hypothetical protein
VIGKCLIDYSMIVLMSDPERVEHAREQIANNPFINLRPARHGNTPEAFFDLRKFLHDNDLRIDESYHPDRTIHVGKVGHWVSFLEYLKYLQSGGFDYGVWIEDDAIVPHDLRGTVEQFVAGTRPPRSVVRLGMDDTADLLVAADINQLFAHFRKTGLDHPTDNYLTYYSLCTASVRYVRRREFDSNITRTPLVEIREVNTFP